MVHRQDVVNELLANEWIDDRLLRFGRWKKYSLLSKRRNFFNFWCHEYEYGTSRSWGRLYRHPLTWWRSRRIDPLYHPSQSWQSIHPGITSFPTASTGSTFDAVEAAAINMTTADATPPRLRRRWSCMHNEWVSMVVNKQTHFSVVMVR